MNQETPDILKGQPCPMCHTNNLTLMETTKDIPYFGVCYIFSMDCSNCNYHMADIESEEKKDPCKYSFEVENEEDLKVRIVKSSKATIKIPRIVTISPGPVSNGYITNVEGIINRVKKMLETQRDDAEDKSAQKKAKNLLKKIQRVLWGREKLIITIEDPSGNSAIISDKAEKK
ncbi:ZPR1 zinc finger domain-containing protein [Candidatus Woesearchaeota archaeon]|nr:ZPR1 zinc finger domain-containing protein [Candidatus Woesearchaeota archaeon]